MNISEVSQDIAVPTLTKTQLTALKWRLANKESVAAYQKWYRASHLERDRQYRHDYHVVNQERHNVHTQNYYIENKDAISVKQAEKFKCMQCGGKYTRSNKLQHERQGIHIKSLEINGIIK